MNYSHPLDPRFERCAPAPEFKTDIVAVECHDDQGDFVTVKHVGIEYSELEPDGDGIEVRVHNAGIFREDCKVQIGDYLKTRVSSWDFVD